MPPRIGAPPPRIGLQGKPVDPFYHSSEWKAAESASKAAAGYQCRMCGADHRKTPFKLRADHIIAIKDGGVKLDPGNIQVLCAACDNRKRALEIRARGRGG